MDFDPYENHDDEDDGLWLGVVLLTAVNILIWGGIIALFLVLSCRTAESGTIRDVLGGNVADWQHEVWKVKQSGDMVCLRGKVQSAPTMMLEMHRYGLLAIAPSARIGLHAVQFRVDPGKPGKYRPLEGEEAAHVKAGHRTFYAAYTAIPGLWAFYSGNGCTAVGCAPILTNEMTIIAGSWFNSVGVPEC